MRRGGQAAATVAFGILLALALLLSYIEVLLPLSIGIPGVKLGLANLASLICLYLFGLRRAALISLLRIILTGFLFGNMAAILYSLSGATLSLTAAVLAKRSQLFGEIGVSVIGAIFHNLGQLAVAALVVQNRGLFPDAIACGRYHRSGHRIAYRRDTAASADKYTGSKRLENVKCMCYALLIL